MVYVKKTAAARLAFPAVTGCLLFLLALRPQQYSAACMQGITLWAGAVLPALFPYFVLTSMLTKMGAADKLSARLSPAARKVKLPGCAAYCFLLSVLSGYPVGARTIADLQAQGALDSKAAARVSLLCSTSGPMFLLGSVGGAMFQDMRAGGILLASHLLGVLIVYLVLLPFLPRLPETPALQSTPREEDVFGKSVQGAIFSILTVGGCIALFSVLGRAADDLHATAPLCALFSPLLGDAGAHALVAGLLEATRGCALLASSGSTLALPAAAFIVTFGGACILAQQLTFLKKAGVNAAFFIGIKLLQALAAFGICLALCALL